VIFILEKDSPFFRHFFEDRGIAVLCAQHRSPGGWAGLQHRGAGAVAVDAPGIGAVGRSVVAAQHAKALFLIQHFRQRLVEYRERNKTKDHRLCQAATLPGAGGAGNAGHVDRAWSRAGYALARRVCAGAAGSVDALLSPGIGNPEIGGRGIFARQALLKRARAVHRAVIAAYYALESPEVAQNVSQQEGVLAGIVRFIQRPGFGRFLA
jgi:hypothetical protein